MTQIINACRVRVVAREPRVKLLQARLQISVPVHENPHDCMCLALLHLVAADLRKAQKTFSQVEGCLVLPKALIEGK